MSDGLTSDLHSELEALRALVNRLAARVAQLENPQGRLFIADTANPGSTHRGFVEMIPNAAGDALQTLTDGRTVSGTTDPGVFLAIPGLTSGQQAFYGFDNGTNKVYVPLGYRLRFGKVQATDDCQTYCTVKPCTEDGTLLSDTIITIKPTKGGCDDAANGFCYTAGDIIAYMESPDSSLIGYQVGAYKSVSMGYTCSDTNSASVPGLNRIQVYPGDYLLVPSGDCSSYTNVGSLYNLGLTAIRYSASNIANIKVLDLSAVMPADGTGTEGTDWAKIGLTCSTGTTSANAPTIGGSLCVDASNPNYLKIWATARLGVVMDWSNPSAITLTVDTNTCTITLDGPTMRAFIP